MMYSLYRSNAAQSWKCDLGCWTLLCSFVVWQVCEIVEICCNHPLRLQHLKLMVVMKTLKSWNSVLFASEGFLPFFALAACLFFHTFFLVFLGKGKSTRKGRKQTLFSMTCWCSMGSDSKLHSLHQGTICSSFPCPSQWCNAGAVGNIIVLFSLIWWVLPWVEKRSELIFILRLQTAQWLLSKGMIYSSSSLAILIPQLHTFVPF